MKSNLKHFGLILLSVMFILLASNLFAQSEDAVEDNRDSQNASELELEKNISERLENMLQPLVGPTVVIVDLELYFPPPELKGFRYSNQESLPGLPVSVSESADANGLNQADVTQISIRIFVSETMPDADVDRISEMIPLWIDLNYKRGDQILVEQVPFVNPPMTLVQFLYSWRVMGIIAGVFVLLLIIIFILFALFGPKRSAQVKSSIEGGVPSGIGGPISAQSIAQLLDTKVDSSSQKDDGKEDSSKSVGGAIGSNVLTLPDEALSIRLVRDDQGRKLFGSLSTIREYKTTNLKQLLDDTSPLIISFALRLANPPVVTEYLRELPEAVRTAVFKAWDTLIELEPEEIKEISEVLRRKIEKTGKLAANLPDAVDKLAEVLNNSPDSIAFHLFRDIQHSNEKLAKKLRPQIFFIEDLDELDTVTLRRLVVNIPKETLAVILAESPEHICEKIYASISHRMADILREEASMVNNVSLDMAAKAKSFLMLSLRQIQSMPKA